VPVVCGAGFKRIIFLNGHYDNTYAIAYGCANAAYKLPPEVKAFPVNYWDGLTADEVAEWNTLKNGLHANLAETSPSWPSANSSTWTANAEFRLPGCWLGPVHGVLLHVAGLIYWRRKMGRGAMPTATPRQESAISRRRPLDPGRLENIEKTFAAMPPR
jgi:creatinine amidohydrolase